MSNISNQQVDIRDLELSSASNLSSESSSQPLTKAQWLKEMNEKYKNEPMMLMQLLMTSFWTNYKLDPIKDQLNTLSKELNGLTQGTEQWNEISDELSKAMAAYKADPSGSAATISKIEKTMQSQLQSYMNSLITKGPAGLIPINSPQKLADVIAKLQSSKGAAEFTFANGMSSTQALTVLEQVQKGYGNIAFDSSGSNLQGLIKKAYDQNTPDPSALAPMNNAIASIQGTISGLSNTVTAMTKLGMSQYTQNINFMQTMLNSINSISGTIIGNQRGQ